MSLIRGFTTLAAAKSMRWGGGQVGILRGAFRRFRNPGPMLFPKKLANVASSLHAYTLTFIHACMHIYKHAHVLTGIHAHMLAGIYALMRACIHALMHTCTHACMHTGIRENMHT